MTPLQQSHFFYPLFQVLLLGVNWSFITGDLFNLFVSYEVMLIGSYGVMMCGSSRQQVRQTLTYVAINLFERRLYILEATVPPGSVPPAEFQQSLSILDGSGEHVRCQLYENGNRVRRGPWGSGR